MLFNWKQRPIKLGVADLRIKWLPQFNKLSKLNWQFYDNWQDALKKHWIKYIVLVKWEIKYNKHVTNTINCKHLLCTMLQLWGNVKSW